MIESAGDMAHDGSVTTDRAPSDHPLKSPMLNNEVVVSDTAKADGSALDDTARNEKVVAGQASTKRRHTSSVSEEEARVSKKARADGSAAEVTTVNTNPTDGPTCLHSLPREILDNVMEHVRDAPNGFKATYNVMCTIKALHKSAMRSVYRNVVIKRDLHACHNVMKNMAKSGTDTLTLYTSDQEDAENTLDEFLKGLRDVPLRELILSGTSATPRVCARLQELFDGGSVLKDRLMILQLPSAYDLAAGPRPMLDLLVQYTFRPSRTDTGDTLTVYGGGYKTLANRAREKSTQLSLFRGVLARFGYPIAGEFEIVSLRMRGPGHECANPFKMVAAPPPTVRFFSINRLRLDHFDFSHGFPLDTYKSIDFSSIRWLELLECQKLPLLLKHFMATDTKLETLELENWSFAEEQYKEDRNGVEAFLASFSTLQQLKILTLSPWQPDLAKMLSTHTGLESCDLSFGYNDITLVMLNKILAIRPHLKHLGYRHKLFELPWKHNAFGGQTHYRTGNHIKGFDAYFPAHAKVLAKFKQLEELALYFEPHVSDDSSSDESSEDESDFHHSTHKLVFDRILMWIREQASVDKSLEESKIEIVILHEKALAGEGVLDEDDVVPQSYYEREFKYERREAKMRYLA